MAIDKSKYIEIAENDRVAITTIFNAMNLTERMTAVLYMLDHYDNCSMPMVKRFMVDENEEYLRCIKEANEPASNRPSSKDQAEDDVLLVEEAVRLYYERNGNKPPLAEEIIESPIEDIKNFYYILIGK
jgi:hypothetical protein